MSEFVIFATARSGSTSLAELLGKGKGVKLCFEPFNENYSQWNPENKNYLKMSENMVSFKNVLNEIYSKFNAVKTLDYQLPEKYYFYLLSKKNLKIIFLRRKNLLELAISDLIAHQVGEWRKSSKIELYKNLKPLDTDEMDKKIKYTIYLNKIYSRYLETNRRSDYLPLWYEDLYSENYSVNKKKVTSICDFLDIKLPNDILIRKYMTPSLSKINYGDIYKQLPNHREILTEFGKYGI